MTAALMVAAIYQTLASVVAGSSGSPGACHTWYEKTAHGEQFRNVMAPPYFATGNGVTDDTAALLAALTSNRSASTGLSGSITPGTVIVYLPPGRYAVQSTLPLPPNTLLIGNYRCRPTLLLTPYSRDFSATQVANGSSLTQYVLDGSNATGWFRGIAHLAIVVGTGNPRATAISWPVALGPSYVRDVDIDVGGGVAGVEIVGSAVQTPSGSSDATQTTVLSRVNVTGGNTGVIVSAAHGIVILRSVVIRDARTACLTTVSLSISLTFSSAMLLLQLLDTRLISCGHAGVNVSAVAGVVALLLVDSAISRATAALVVSDASKSSTTILLQRVAIAGVGSIIPGIYYSPTATATATMSLGGSWSAAAGSSFATPATSTPSETVFFQSWYTGESKPGAFVGGEPVEFTSGDLPPGQAAALAIADRPTLDGMDIGNALTLGAIGDGMADDTSAIEAAIALHTVVFLPHTAGGYRVTRPLKLRPCTVLVGEARSVLLLDMEKGLIGTSPQSGAGGTPVVAENCGTVPTLGHAVPAMVLVLGSMTNATVTAALIDVLVSTMPASATQGCILLQWGSDNAIPKRFLSGAGTMVAQSSGGAGNTTESVATQAASSRALASAPASVSHAPICSSGFSAAAGGGMWDVTLQAAGAMQSLLQCAGTGCGLAFIENVDGSAHNATQGFTCIGQTRIRLNTTPASVYFAQLLMVGVSFTGVLASQFVFQSGCSGATMLGAQVQGPLATVQAAAPGIELVNASNFTAYGVLFVGITGGIKCVDSPGMSVYEVASVNNTGSGGVLISGDQNISCGSQPGACILIASVPRAASTFPTCTTAVPTLTSWLLATVTASPAASAAKTKRNTGTTTIPHTIVITITASVSPKWSPSQSFSRAGSPGVAGVAASAAPEGTNSSNRFTIIVGVSVAVALIVCLAVVCTTIIMLRRRRRTAGVMMAASAIALASTEDDDSESEGEMRPGNEPGWQ